MQATADIVDGRIILTAPPTARDLLLSIPGCNYHAKTGTWRAPLSWATAMAARGTFGEGLEITDALDEWGHGELERLTRVEKAKAGGSLLPFAAGLREFQRTGASFLVASERCILGDDRGTGKTIQAVAALQVLGLPCNALPALIVCPNVMRYTWAAELEKWAPGLAVSVVIGTKPQRVKALRPGFDVYVIGWASLAAHSRVSGYGSIKLSDEDRREKELDALGLRTVILDEAHRAKSPDAKQTRAAWHLCHAAYYAWLLTGTPLTQDGGDVWSLLHALDPAMAPSRGAYEDRYYHVRDNWAGYREVGALRDDRKDELFSWLDPVFLRRSKAEVLPELPAKTYSTRWVDITGPQPTAYKAMKDEMLAPLDGGVLAAGDPLVQLTRLVQLASATPVLGLVKVKNQDGEMEERQGVVSLKTPSCKVDALLEIVEDQAGEPLVVFAESRKLIELCSRELDRAKVPHGLITGSVPEAARQEAVQRFQAGELPVILCTIGAGGEGITLHRASTAVFLQRSYSLAANLQADDRIHRMGQTAEAVNIIDVVARGTVEERVHAIVSEKEGRLQEICRDPEWARRLLV